MGGLSIFSRTKNTCVLNFVIFWQPGIKGCLGSNPGPSDSQPDDMTTRPWPSPEIF